MCKFNTGCTGHQVDDGFVDCTIQSGCATGPAIVTSAAARRLGMRLADIKDRIVGPNQIDAAGWKTPANHLFS